MQATSTNGKRENFFQLTPVEGCRNRYILRIQTPPGSVEEEMTETDWDKFEKDIEDAFEQVP